MPSWPFCPIFFFSCKIIVRLRALIPDARRLSCQKAIWEITPKHTSNRKTSSALSRAAMSLTVVNSASRCTWRNTTGRATSFAPSKTARRPSTRREIWRRIWDCTLVKNPTIAQLRIATSHLPRRVTWTITSWRPISSATAVPTPCSRSPKCPKLP